MYTLEINADLPLNEILLRVSDYCRDYHWVIYEFFAHGGGIEKDAGKQMKLEEEANNSKSGKVINWDELNDLPKSYDQLETLILGGSRISHKEECPDMDTIYRKNDIIMEMIDGYTWIFHIKEKIIFDKLSKINDCIYTLEINADLPLNEILLRFSDYCRDYHWVIYEFYAYGGGMEKDSEKQMELEKEINNSRSGKVVSWDELNDLPKSYDQLKTLILVGSRISHKMEWFGGRYSLCEKNDIVIELIDGYNWILHIKERVIFDKLSSVSS